MLFQAPALDAQERGVLDQIEELKRRLRFHLHEPRRWLGSLRRLTFAKNIQGSNSIEGYVAELDDAAAVVLGEEPLDATTETRLALEGYRDAMTYVLQLAPEDDFTYNEQLIKSLHFMMTSYDLKARPGRWRVGPVYVQRERTGEIVHEGVDFEQVAPLMRELVDALEDEADKTPPLIRAGMAHLNLVMIHPFKDGNGRMARCLQSLVLARQGVLAPEFMSIEEYLGADTESYYNVLGQVGGGSWQPHRNARPWVRFLLTAHLRQARTVLKRVEETEKLWLALEPLMLQYGIQERAINALFDVANGFRVRRSTYMAYLETAGEPISEQTATRDFKDLVSHGLLTPRGEKRGRYYVASDTIRDIRRKIVAERDPRDDVDPFTVQVEEPRAAAIEPEPLF
jgi:Fic family protein